MLFCLRGAGNTVCDTASYPVSAFFYLGSGCLRDVVLCDLCSLSSLPVGLFAVLPLKYPVRAWVRGRVRYKRTCFRTYFSGIFFFYHSTILKARLGGISANRSGRADPVVAELIFVAFNRRAEISANRASPAHVIGPLAFSGNLSPIYVNSYENETKY